MKLKLTHSQFMALYAILQCLVQLEGIKALSNDGLQHIVLVGLYQKFYNKAFEKKKQYSVKLSPAEAIAFWLWFKDSEHLETSFEGNLLRQQLNNIHQNFIN